MCEAAKEWKSTDDQLEIIRSRGMAINNEDAARALLSQVGYYRLSGYWYPFRQFATDSSGIRADAFVEGSQFSDVAALYFFDRKLRLLALDALERIELAIQVEVAHLIGERDPFAHENAAQLHGNFSRQNNPNYPSRHEEWLAGYNRLVDRSTARPLFATTSINIGGSPSGWRLKCSILDACQNYMSD